MVFEKSFAREQSVDGSFENSFVCEQSADRAFENYFVLEMTAFWKIKNSFFLSLLVPRVAIYFFVKNLFTIFEKFL